MKINLLVKYDVRQIFRDPLLAYMAFATLLFAFLTRWLTSKVGDWWGDNITAYHPLVLSFLFIFQPVLFGCMVGFLLLDEKDENTLAALRVTPMPLWVYLTYRLIMPALLGMLLTLISMPITNLTAQPIYYFLPVILVTALVAPIMALLPATLASNKVEGLSIVKVISQIALLLPIIAFFIQPPWQWLFGLCPTYWPVKACWLAMEGNWSSLFWICIGVAVVYYSLLTYVLFKKFSKKIL